MQITAKRQVSYKNNTYKYNILLIEDSAIIQEVHKDALQRLGCKVDVASNGKEAIELFENNIYDLIFLDIGLPDMSGIDVAKHIRKHENQDQDHKITKRNIIIVLSSDENNVSKCREAGCDAFHAKPTEFKILEDLLIQWIPQSLTIINSAILE